MAYHAYHHGSRYYATSKVPVSTVEVEHLIETNGAVGIYDGSFCTGDVHSDCGDDANGAVNEPCSVIQVCGVGVETSFSPPGSPAGVPEGGTLQPQISGNQGAFGGGELSQNFKSNPIWKKWRLRERSPERGQGTLFCRHYLVFGHLLADLALIVASMRPTKCHHCQSACVCAWAPRGTAAVTTIKRAMPRRTLTAIGLHATTGAETVPRPPSFPMEFHSLFTSPVWPLRSGQSGGTASFLMMLHTASMWTALRAVHSALTVGMVTAQSLIAPTDDGAR